MRTRLKVLFLVTCLTSSALRIIRGVHKESLPYLRFSRILPNLRCLNGWCEISWLSVGLARHQELCRRILLHLRLCRASPPNEKSQRAKCDDTAHNQRSVESAKLNLRPPMLRDVHGAGDLEQFL